MQGDIISWSKQILCRSGSPSLCEIQRSVSRTKVEDTGELASYMYQEHSVSQGIVSNNGVRSISKHTNLLFSDVYPFWSCGGRRKPMGVGKMRICVNNWST